MEYCMEMISSKSSSEKSKQICSPELALTSGILIVTGKLSTATFAGSSIIRPISLQIRCT